MSLIVATAAGIIIGILFYGGLWLTVRALITARRPAMLAVASFWIRTAMVLGSVVLIARGRWQSAVAVLAGIALSRTAVSIFLSRREPRCT